MREGGRVREEGTEREGGEREGGREEGREGENEYYIQESGQLTTHSKFNIVIRCTQTSVPEVFKKVIEFLKCLIGNLTVLQIIQMPENRRDVMY